MNYVAAPNPCPQCGREDPGFPAARDDGGGLREAVARALHAHMHPGAPIEDIAHPVYSGYDNLAEAALAAIRAYDASHAPAPAQSHDLATAILAAQVNWTMDPSSRPDAEAEHIAAYLMACGYTKNAHEHN